jgi:CRISPR-associated endonuclease/helicase Cas3
MSSARDGVPGTDISETGRRLTRSSGPWHVTKGLTIKGGTVPAPRKRIASEHIGVAHESCWAKTLPDGTPGISVWDHCLNVGCVAEALLDQLPVALRTPLPSGITTLAALHDVGKVSPGFQAKCTTWLTLRGLTTRALAEGWQFGEQDHAKVSQASLQTLFRRATLYPWAAILGAHHGRIKGWQVQIREPWDDERGRLAAELSKEFGPLPTGEPDNATLWFIAGLITVADWIGSDERQFPQQAPDSIAARRSRARRALGGLGWTTVRIRSPLGFGDLFASYVPNGLQTIAIDAVRNPGVYVIEGPMGCGKTEAALAAAYRLLASGEASGVYFALPTQVTSNRIHLRVQPFVERIADHAPALRLAHSASWLVQTDPPPALRPASSDAESEEHTRAGRSWFASPKRAVLAPFGVGTIDQALLAVVAANHFFVRQFGLAGKVVILDEIHSYDLYTSTLIDTLVQRLRELHCTVIILSATLTAERRRQLLAAGSSHRLSEAYPLVSASGNPPIEISCEPPPPKTVTVRFVEPAALIENCLERAHQGQCVLRIRNTVDEAQDTYRRLMATNYEGGPPIALLHSRFPFFRREELEEYWMNALGKDTARRPKGCVVVSTQVAEQSVDIDADLLITELAPTDMLLQRLGRLWRHERLDRPCAQPEVWMQSPPITDAALMQTTAKALREGLGKSARVYAPYVLLRSLQQWRGRSAITLPTDIRAILEATYADPPVDEPTAWQELWEELEGQKRRLAAQALSVMNVWTMPALKDEEGVQTRYSTYPMAQLLLTTEIESLDSHSARLRLLDGAGVVAHDRDWNFDAAKAIHRNLTRVPHWAVASALPHQPRWLTNHVSQPTAVARLQPDGSVRWFGDEQHSGISYQGDQGIIIHREHIPRRSQEELDESYD